MGRPPNVLWITLDSVRADHTAIGGYERETTPAMARLAAEGTGFDTCIAHSHSTLPSSGAILTGYAPTRTRIGIDGETVPDAVRTIPERFSAAGYTTACLSRNSFVSSATGLDRGFDRFTWLSSSTLHSLHPATLLKYLRHVRTHSAGLTLDTAKHSSPLLMNETAKRWLREFERDDDPFFFYLHYNEPHRPYYPPNSHLDAFDDDLDMSPREAAEFSLDVHYDLNEIVATGCPLSDEERRALTAMYDAEIAYTDDMVGRLVSFLRSLDLEDTVVVITGDHGELFGEWGLLSHRCLLTDPVTRVPLVLHGFPDDLAVSDDDILQHADIMTTLMRVAGIECDDTLGYDLRETTREFAVSQRGPQDFGPLLDHDPTFDASRFHEHTLTALRTPDHRYQKSEDGADLFDVTDESVDIIDRERERARELDRLLEAWLEAEGRPITEPETAEFTDSMREQLEDLGYLS